MIGLQLGVMIGRQRGTRTSPVVSFDSLLSFLSTTSTFVLVALFPSRVLEYQWAQQCTFLTFVGWSPPSYLRLRFHSQNNETGHKLQKPSSSAKLFGTSTIFSVLLNNVDFGKCISRNFPFGIGTLAGTLPHHLLKCVISTRISRLAT